MIFAETKLPGVYIIDPVRIEDERGFFARVFCADEFAAYGLHTDYPQCNISFNRQQGTLRGMHYQAPPHGEVKVVRCTQGAIYDVVVDLRPLSPTFKQWVSVELSAANQRMLYIPINCAHGFQTLTPNSEVYYMMGTRYHAPSSCGVRWDDPVFGITWPMSVTNLSDRDASYALWQQDKGQRS